MSVVPILGFPSVARYPTFPASTITPYIGGGLYASLGGAPAAAPLPSYQSQFLVAPDYGGSYPETAPWSDHLLFGDFTAAQLTAGRTVYRGLFFRATQDIASLAFYLQQPSIGTFKSQVGALSSQNTISVLSSETSSPGGTFSSPTSGSPASIGDVDAGDYIFLWLERVVSSSSAAKNWEAMSIVFTATDCAPRVFNFYQHLLSEQTISAVTSSREPQNVYQQDGEVFTITTTGDPASNLIYVMITGGDRVVPFGEPKDAPVVTQFLDVCERVGSTSYRYRFRPGGPGYYHIQFFTAETHWNEERYVQA